MDTAIARTEPLPSYRHGYIDYTEWPFKIRINSNDPFGRQLVTFVHEIVHGGNRLHKWSLSENDVHALSIFILSEILPGIEKLRNLKGLNAWNHSTQF